MNKNNKKENKTNTQPGSQQARDNQNRNNTINSDDDIITCGTSFSNKTYTFTRKEFNTLFPGILSGGSD